jgi:hypothetical protein
MLRHIPQPLGLRGIGEPSRPSAQDRHSASSSQHSRPSTVTDPEMFRNDSTDPATLSRLIRPSRNDQEADRSDSLVFFECFTIPP